VAAKKIPQLTAAEHLSHSWADPRPLRHKRFQTIVDNRVAGNGFRVMSARREMVPRSVVGVLLRDGETEAQKPV
jgi:hypothetical protein